MKFFLGTHKPHWLERTTVPLFVSRRRLIERKTPPVPTCDWALDSGAYTELDTFGEWRTTEREYISAVRHFYAEIGRLEWVAPMDWMCEPHILERTRLTVDEHQRRTVENFLNLRDRLGVLVIPVLQGWTLDDYQRCWALYEEYGVDLEMEDLVGLGTICRRQDTVEAGRIVRSLAPLRLHGFGVKITGLESFSDALASADSMAWSYRARRDHALPGCPHKSCTNCLRYALRWRDDVMYRLNQQRLEVA